MATVFARKAAEKLAANTRRFSSNADHIAQERDSAFGMLKTKMAVVLLGVALGAGVVIRESGHHHDHIDKTKYPYLQQRPKQFAWDSFDCSFWNLDCKKKWKQGKRGEELHGFGDHAESHDKHH